MSPGFAIPDALPSSPLRRASVFSIAPPFVRCSERESADYHIIRPRGFHVFERLSSSPNCVLETLPKVKTCSGDDVQRIPCPQIITLIQIVVSVLVYLRLV